MERRRFLRGAATLPALLLLVMCGFVPALGNGHGGPFPPPPPPPTGQVTGMTTVFMEAGSAATQGAEFYFSVGPTLTGTGAVTSDSAIVHTGSRSLKCAVGSSSGSNAYLQKPLILADAGRRISVWMYLTAYPTAGNTATILNMPPGIADVKVDSSGLLSVAAGSTSGSGPAPLNTWFRVSLGYSVTSTTVFSFQLFLNGGLISTSTTGTLGAAGTSELDLGWISGTPPANGLLYLSDVYADNGTDSGDPGDIRVTAKRPYGNSANAFATAIGNNPANRWLNMNEQPLSETNGWEQDAPAHGDYGNDVIPGTVDALAATTKRFCKFTTPSAIANVNSIHVYCDRTLTGTGYAIDGAIYTDNAGVPNALVANSSITINSNITKSSPQWYTGTYGTKPTLSANTVYWIGILATKASNTYDDAGTSNQMATRADTLPFDDPFGASPTFAARKMGVYLTYDNGNAAGNAENYGIEGADDPTSDAVIGQAPIVARCAWIWARCNSDTGNSGATTLFDNGAETSITLPKQNGGGLTSIITDTTIYPVTMPTIGLRASQHIENTYFYECGMLIAFRGDALMARNTRKQELLAARGAGGWSGPRGRLQKRN